MAGLLNCVSGLVRQTEIGAKWSTKRYLTNEKSMRNNIDEESTTVNHIGKYVSKYWRQCKIYILGEIKN